MDIGLGQALMAGNLSQVSEPLLLEILEPTMRPCDGLEQGIVAKWRSIVGISDHDLLLNTPLGETNRQLQEERRQILRLHSQSERIAQSVG